MREDIDPVQWAGQQAVVALPVHMDASNAGQIREGLLSVTAEHVSRVLSLTGLDHLVPIYPSREAATAGSPPAEALAVVAGPGLGGSTSRGGSTVGYGR